MELEFWCRTDKGLRRENNQDSYLVNKNLGLFIVADGMGGHQGGEVASSIAVKTAEEVITHGVPQNPRDLMTLAYAQASQRIFDKATSKMSELFGMGTTMVMANIHQDQLYIGNVGDSRAYLYKAPFAWQLTEDHSLMNDQLRAGIIKESDVKNFANKNVITRSVGFEREVQVDIIQRQIQKGEIYVLCSDGLSGLVSDEKITKICQDNTPDKIVDKCIEQALASGGHDNVTVLVLHFK